MIDKEKLLKQLKSEVDRIPYLERDCCTSQTEELITKIENGQFNKPPCEHCISGHYRDLKGTSYSADLYPFCPKCGRELEAKQ